MSDKRLSLTSLHLNRIVVSKNKEPAPAPLAAQKARERELDSFKFMPTRIDREGWRELTNLSTDLDRPLQSPMIEAINDFLGKHGRPHQLVLWLIGALVSASMHQLVCG
jgi:hypothetical protein